MGACGAALLGSWQERARAWLIIIIIIIKHLLPLAPCFFTLFHSFPATHFPPQPLPSPAFSCVPAGVVGNPTHILQQPALSLSK